MCGDTMCPSCGPAQGFDIALNKFIEGSYERYEKLWELVEEADIEDFLVGIIEEARQDGQSYGEVEAAMLFANDDGKIERLYDDRMRLKPEPEK
jgi:hypothetical protein